MDYQRWAQIEELLQLALDLGPDERAAFLERACAGDVALRSAVEDLLRREAEAESFLESPAVARADEPVDVPPPSRISHYRIEARIGKGGMGEVYKARDETLRRVVALKMLPAEFTSDPERVRRFEQEALAASRLNHPNIITIFEITGAGGAHFIVQEFVEGQTLRELLTDPRAKKPRRLGVERTLEIATQIAGALKAAHTAWIIHRDIKPENIMVREDGLVKVLDFGIAKLGEEQTEGASPRRHGEEGAAATPPHAHAAATLTIPGTIMGTASYMSPEQARGEQLDGRTDLFSLGLLLYEMATGERLFTGATWAEALRSAQRVKEVLPPSARFGQVPKELQRIIRKALRRDREQRYASAGEMLDDLGRLQRRLENRAARRVIGLSALAVAAAVTVAVIAAFLSVSEVWEERVLRDGHTAAVRRAVFSPDGRLLVSGGEDQQVIVWDFPRRERLKTFTDHTGVINAVAFSPDGQWFATGSNDHTVIVWDAARLEKAVVLREHSDPVLSVTFSPDGRLLVSASKLTIVWETGGWKKVRELPGGYSYGNHVFLDDGRRLADMTGRTWDLSTGQLVRDAQDDWLGNWAATSPDGTRWVSVDAGGNVKFVDLARQKSLAVRHTHHDHGRSVAFSPDGRLVATAAERVVLWDAATRAKLVPLEYESIVWSVAFSPDGRWLVSTHGDGAILAWDVAERELAANLREHSGGVRAVAFSPDGRRLASASEDKSVIVWDAEGGRKEAVLDGHQTRVTAVAFSPDGRWLASADHSGTIILWDAARRAPRVTFEAPELEYSYCLAISPDGRSAATTYAVYDLENGRPLIPRGGTFWSRVYSAAFSADGRLLIGVTDLGEIIFVNARTWQLLERQKLVDVPLISLSLSPDGRHLVTGDDGKAVRLWAIEPLRQVGVIGRHEARIKSVAFSPDGKQVASAGDDKMVALWDVSRRTLINTIGTHTSPVYSIAFSPDGQRLVSGEHDRSVRIYTRHRTLWGFRLN
jgi:WD40 repeat protein/serine/threonine protein kinase